MKGNAALVGSSGPQALFIMILSFFPGAWVCACVAPSANNGKLASRERRDRRIMFPPLNSKWQVNLRHSIPSPAKKPKLNQLSRQISKLTVDSLKLKANLERRENKLNGDLCE